MDIKLIAFYIMCVINIFLLLKVMKYKMQINEMEYNLKRTIMSMSKVMAKILMDKNDNLDEAIDEFHKKIKEVKEREKYE